MDYHPVTSCVKLLFSLVYVSVFYNPVLMELVCGPFTIQPKPDLLYMIALIELVRTQYPLLCKIISRIGHFSKIVKTTL
jgi:hypothetical protein